MVQQASRLAPGQEQQDTACRHHWVIEAPTGPVSRGTCQQCGNVREFKNYIESAPWGEDTSASQAVSEYRDTSSSDDAEESEEG